MLTQQSGLWEGGECLADMGEGGQPALDGGWAPEGLLLTVQEGPRKSRNCKFRKRLEDGNLTLFVLTEQAYRQCLSDECVGQ